MAAPGQPQNERTVDQIPYLRLVEPYIDHQTAYSETESKSADTSKSSKNKNILIVEDEAGVRALMEDLLFMEGYDAISVSDGQQGILRFKEQPFDLVFTDLRMPGISGSEVAKAIKAFDPKIPVVIVTGWDTEPFEDELANAGVDRVLYKPFDMDEILSLVTELTGGNAVGA